jgi:PAS domain S-box-containing protein
VAYPYGQAPDQQLAASEQRYQQEFGPAPFGLFTIGLGGERRHRYRAVNDAYCALTGYRRDELSGEDFWRDVHPDELPALRTWCEDVIMPGMTGQAFADQARDLRPGLTVLFMSGYQQESATASWPQGSTPVIGKPFSRAALLAHVAQALAAPAETPAAASGTAQAAAGNASQAADPSRPSPIDW